MHYKDVFCGNLQFELQKRIENHYFGTKVYSMID